MAGQWRCLLLSSRRWFVMEALFSSTLAVTVAEIGDKTQLLALFLAARYSQPRPIVLGIFIATILNHSLSAWLGVWVATLIPPEYFAYIISASFVLIALWLLVPDKDDDSKDRFAQYGPFVATVTLFFLAEMGDKTQIATVILSAKYSVDFISTCLVIFGTTLGMLIANVPVIYAGKWIMERVPLDTARKFAFVIFIGLAILTFFGANSFSI